MSMIGQLAISKAGHDKDTVYVIAGQKEDFVYLCDGKKKLPAAPKKKRRKHIQPINEWVDDELLNKLQSGMTVYPEEIKYELSDFLYHAMVLMALKGVTWDDIVRELADR